jgi:hypothetical protein
LGEVLIDEGKAAEAATLLRQAAKEIHEVPCSLSAWQIAEPEALGAALAAVGEMTEAERLLKNSDSRLKDYPEAALHRLILTRAQGGSRKSLYTRLSLANEFAGQSRRSANLLKQWMTEAALFKLF